MASILLYSKERSVDSLSFHIIFKISNQCCACDGNLNTTQRSISTLSDEKINELCIVLHVMKNLRNQSKVSSKNCKEQSNQPKHNRSTISPLKEVKASGAFNESWGVVVPKQLLFSKPLAPKNNILCSEFNV